MKRIVAALLAIGASATAHAQLIRNSQLATPPNEINVRSVGMAPGGQDNSPYVSALMALFPASQSSNTDVVFPAVSGQQYTDYYFSQTFVVNRHMHIRCGGEVTGGDATTRLIFQGVTGIFVDFPNGGGGISGCGIVNLNGQSVGSFSSGSANVTNLSQFNAVGWTAGDGILAWLGGPSTGPATPPGTSVISTNPGASSLVMSNNATYTGTTSNPIWRLPVAEAFSITTTSGSPTVTLTAGPSLIRTGSLVWSDAFPLGTTVRDVTGTTIGTQTLTMGDAYLSASTVNATVTHTSGSGTLWVLPAAIHQNIAFNKDRTYMAYFFSGEQRSCSDNTIDQVGNDSGCSGDSSTGNYLVSNVIGRYSAGNNTAVSTSQGDVFGGNSFSDIVDATQLGDVTIGDVLNSAEAQTSLYNLMGLCGSNYPTYIQVYQGGTPQPYCMSGAGIGVAPTVGAGPIFLGAPGNVNSGASLIYDGLFNGPWTAFAGDTNTSVVCLNATNAPNPNIPLSFGTNGICVGPNAWNLQYAGPGYWSLSYWQRAGGNTVMLTEGATTGYTGYTNGNMSWFNFPQGFLLYDAESSWSPGPERLVDEGASIPAGTFHQQGDIHFNQNAVPGTYAGWIDTASGAHFVPFGLISGSVAIASLPTCNSTNVATQSWISNGITSPTYHQAVSSTGTATWPVFCTYNGSSYSWVY